MKIACLILIKNDEIDGINKIIDTFDSTKDFVQIYIVYNISNENQEINQEIMDTVRCNNKNKELRMIEGTFVDYSVSQNKLLNYAETFQDCEYFLLVDCGDILRNGNELVDFCLKYEGLCSGFFVKQEWFYGGNKTCIFFNVRLIKSRHGWRYRKSSSRIYLSGGN